MSMSFDIFPTNTYIPKYEELKNLSQEMLKDYFAKENIDIDIFLEFNTKDIVSGKNINCDSLITNETEYSSFSINGIGESLIFYRKITDIDKEFWKEEIELNHKANELKEKIERNIKLGYMWNVKRTMNQPAIINIYYGFLAIAIAILTNGILYSDDGAWDYHSFPIGAEQFRMEYLNLYNLQDKNIKEYIKKCLYSLKGCK